jgi:hypothetical protein
MSAWTRAFQRDLLGRFGLNVERTDHVSRIDGLYCFYSSSWSVDFSNTLPPLNISYLVIENR